MLARNQSLLRGFLFRKPPTQPWWYAGFEHQARRGHLLLPPSRSKTWLTEAHQFRRSGWEPVHEENERNTRKRKAKGRKPALWRPGAGVVTSKSPISERIKTRRGLASDVPDTGLNPAGPVDQPDRASLNIGMRSHPRKTYLEDCASPPVRLPEGAQAARRLAVFDLNNTLLVRERGPSKLGSQLDKSNLRPYYQPLLEYCLGLESDPPMTTDVDAKTHGPIEVLFWSSVVEVNAHRFLDLLLGTTRLKERVLDVWSRKTLVPEAQLWSNVEVTKDLDIVWYAFNTGSNARLMAESRSWQDLERPEDEYGDTSHSAIAAAEAQKVGPWNASNTLVLDDEVFKVRLNTHNHVPVLGYSSANYDAIKTLRQRPLSWLKGAPTVSLYPPSMAPDWARGSITENQGDLNAREEEEAREVAWDFLLRMDTCLLQCIGVLDESLHQEHVGRWINAGGLEGFSGPSVLPDDITTGIIMRPLKEADGLAREAVQRLRAGPLLESPQTTLDWIIRGVHACAKRGIPLTLEHAFFLRSGIYDQSH